MSFLLKFNEKVPSLKIKQLKKLTQIKKIKKIKFNTQSTTNRTIK